LSNIFHADVHHSLGYDDDSEDEDEDENEDDLSKPPVASLSPAVPKVTK
jgi:hypothetical protein